MIVALTLLLAAAPASEVTIDLDAGVGVGALVSPNLWDLDKVPDYGNGPTIGSALITLQSTLTLGHWVGIRGELAFVPMRALRVQNVELALSYRGAAVVNLAPAHIKWMPYFTTGLGAYHRVGPNADIDLRWDWGFGLKTRVSFVTLFLEVRHAITDGVGRGQIANNVEMFLGCSFDLFRGVSKVSAREPQPSVEAAPKTAAPKTTTPETKAKP